MRKNDLIKMLQNIEGNPEVMFWNGFVEDWQHISKDYVETSLYKCSKEFIAKCLLNELIVRDGCKYTPELVEEVNQHAKTAFKNDYEWELLEDYGVPVDIKKQYGRNKRNIVLLQAKRRGVETFDRLGNMRY